MDNARVHCDLCGKEGLRPRMHPAPKGWFWLEAKDDDDPNGTLIILACSEKCASAQWHKGPGPRWTPAELEETAYKGKPTPKTMPHIVKDKLVKTDPNGTRWYECLLDDGTTITISIPGPNEE